MERKKREVVRYALLVGLLACSLPRPAQAGPILINGSFELGPQIPSNDILIPDASADILGWTVFGASIDYLGPPWNVQDGLRAVDLNGHHTVFSGIQQTFATGVGQTYDVSFYLSGNPQGAPEQKQLRVSVEGFSQDYLHNGIGQTLDRLVWQDIRFSFQATGSTATLSFLSSATTPTSYGPLIDNVEVHAVPEPPSLLVIGVAGLVIVSAQRRWGQRLSQEAT